ncbi:Glycine/D-amino acid oxidase [Alkalibacterium putridalgicola]|uniref:(2Fe-2S)-binding protein n=1 Tax=Alkalibacterium putridalgicola TaxID=426703 RepID=A0A1H7XMI1_9LACT|nr:FAD-dependent oxidoreductase [Alkalibacterium putridalgicola]GEK90303.1 (2Fe-2S)-binding protein [Alkalibacterium putridalgicola]SEM34885.1 Glycine/D-amino acid oxidase [Alkalibacterium putridalgicola]
MDNKQPDSQISQFPNSYWHSHQRPHFSPLIQDESTEVAVIGGGIVGIVTAYLLAKAGKKVTLVEAREFFHGVTGHTTAKITAQHALIYNELIQTFGKEKARLYYEANRDGLDFIRETSKELNIDCDFEEKDAVVFASSAKGLKQIEKEARAYETLDINGTLTHGQLRDLPFETLAALTMPYQAQFHPVKYLKGLLDEVSRLGGQIYDRTRAVKLSKSDNTVTMENGAVLSYDEIVVASHYPFNDFDGLYFSKLSINRSYAIAGRINKPIPDGMYISAESPIRSLRSIPVENGNDLFLIGGDSHQTGKSNPPNQVHFENLLAFGKEWFELEEVEYHWSAQDMTTLDKVPYIGQMTRTSENVLVATGFNKWGMAMGVSAAKILTDIINGEENDYVELFDPTRNKLKGKDIQRFSKKNTSVGKNLLETKLQRPDKSPEDLDLDEGGLVSIGGKKLGGYRDENGELHLVKTTCSHMGCGLNWNNSERSWDCPCHGSRFSYSGDVLNGPAVKPLKKVDEKKSVE